MDTGKGKNRGNVPKIVVDKAMEMPERDCNKPKKDTAKKEAIAVGENTFRDSFQDRSLSSFIQAVSDNLFGGDRRSSSFLVGRESARFSIVHPPNVAAQIEVLRKESVNQNSISCSREEFPHSLLFNSANLEAKEDPWVDLDRTMKNSSVCGPLEGNDFVELSNRFDSRLQLNGKNEEFVDADEANKRFDEEENERAQFLQSENASFLVSDKNNTFSQNDDTFSATRYFLARSSFPVSNHANNSTMFGDISSLVVDEKKSLECTNPSKTGRESVHNVAFIVPDQLQSHKNLVCPPTSLCNPNPEEVTAKFLLGPESDGLNTSAITNHIINTVRLQKKEEIAINSNSNMKSNPPTFCPKIIVPQESQRHDKKEATALNRKSPPTNTHPSKQDISTKKSKPANVCPQGTGSIVAQGSVKHTESNSAPNRSTKTAQKEDITKKITKSETVPPKTTGSVVEQVPVSRHAGCVRPAISNLSDKTNFLPKVSRFSVEQEYLRKKALLLDEKIANERRKMEMQREYHNKRMDLLSKQAKLEES